MYTTNNKTKEELNIKWVPAGEKYIIINPATGDWLLLDSVSKQIITEIMEGADLSDIYLRYPTVDKRDIIYLLQQVQARDFTTKHDIMSFNCGDCQNGKFPTLAVLNLTERCNLKCTYCYVGAGEDQVEYMKPETAFRIIDEYMAMNPDEKSNITMHGGEPLLNYSLVEQIVDYAKPFRDKIDLSIQTNATLLTEERARFLKDNNVSVGVSIDGPQKYHDQTRPMQNGKGSFEHVMRGINLLQDGDYSVGTISVLTAHDIEHVDEIIDFFIENNIFDLSLFPMQRIGRGLTDSDSYLTGEQIFRGFQKVIDKIVEYNSVEEHKRKIVERKTSQLAKIIFYNIKDFMCMRMPCGAGTDILGFGIHGDFYMCDDFINDEEFKIGNVFAGSIKDQMIQSDVLKEKMKRFPKDLPRCKNCVWRNLCGGVCYSTDHYSGADGVEQTETCIFYRKIIPYMIQKYAENPDLPVLLNQDLKGAGKSFFFCINEGDKAIDLECYRALLKIHDVFRYNNVYIYWNREDNCEELPDMLNAVRDAYAYNWIVMDPLNPVFSHLTELLKSVQIVDNIRIVIKKDIIKSINTVRSLIEVRNRTGNRTAIEVVIPLEYITSEKADIQSFVTKLSGKDKVVITCKTASEEDYLSLNTFLAEIRQMDIKATVNLLDAKMNGIDTDNLLFVRYGEEKDMVYIDENHFAGISVSEIPDGKIEL